jgi:hypothetical protein
MSHHASRRFRLATFAVALAACGSDGGLTGGGGGNVTLDASQAVNDSIGSAGGVLTATSSAGITYTLTIPAGALQAPTRITLTPIKDQTHLPVSGGFAAGADFQPAGLQFAQPVRLAAHPLPAAPAGMQLIAVTFEGDGDSLGLAPLADSSGTLITFLTHFSAASFIFGTTADLELLAQQTTTGSANQAFLNQLAALGIPLPPGNPAALPILQAWFASVILPELQGAGTDAELLLAVGDYTQWANVAFLYLTGDTPLAPLVVAAPTQPTLPPSLANQVRQASQAAAPVLRNAIAGNNAVCRSQRSVQAILNEFFWQGYAQYFRVDTPAEQLDVATITAALCARIAADSIGLPNPLTAGQAVSLDLVWGVLIGSSPPVIPGDFEITMSGASGLSVAHPSGFTGPDPEGGSIRQGFYTTVVTAVRVGTVSVNARACLILPGTTVASPFCTTVPISGNAVGLSVVGLWTGVGNVILNDQSVRQGQSIEVSICDRVVNDPLNPLAVTITSGPQGGAFDFRDDMIGIFTSGDVVTATSITGPSSQEGRLTLVFPGGGTTQFVGGWRGNGSHGEAEVNVVGVLTLVSRIPPRCHSL